MQKEVYPSNHLQPDNGRERSFYPLDHYIVGVGASAGGLEAIHDLFDNIPQDTNFSFVIIQHLSPDYKSLMAELLTKHTQMQVSEAEDGMLVKQNCVYVIPNKKLITIRHGKLRLTEKNAGNAPNTAIDTFFQSLAEDKGSRAIAIVLSGTGTDGSRGIDAIKNKGGLVVVQDPATAKFDGMPNSAIATGKTDFILPPELMPGEIISYIQSNYPDDNATEESMEGIDQATVEEILALVHQHTSHDFTSYKRHTIHRRILRRMQAHRIRNIEAYLAFLKKNTDETKLLCKDFLIGVTKFFRDADAFEVIRRKVIPAITAPQKTQDTLKIWVAACSTGEEAYSIAILVQEHLERTKQDLSVKIFATDIDQEAIECASRGLYTEAHLKDVSPQRLDQFFVREGNKFCISPLIRKMVIFAHHNVMKDPPYSKIDLVSCRNMLIYMTPALQKKVLNTFHFSLNTDGYLFMGSSENPGELQGSLQEVSKRWRIYQVIQPAKGYLADSLPNPPLPLKKDLIRPTEPRATHQLGNRLGELFNDVLMEEFGYVGICVNENFDLIQAIGAYQHFLQLPEKKLQFNLLKMVPKELALAMSTAVRRAIKTNARSVSRTVNIKTESEKRSIHLLVKPYLSSNQFGQKFILILLNEERSPVPVSTEPEPTDRESVQMEEYNHLEMELKETRENLNATVEELETSNEELQSSNEELISSNEELQSTNEELQSLNEELHTVNSEHQLKIRELIELNDDLNNYFRSTDIGQIFLDKNLIIRKYTPAVVRQVNLIDSDIGRPIQHFSYNIKYDRLIDDIRHVINTSETIEREIELSDGRFSLMRILPYLRLAKQTDGVVVTFVDITALKNLNHLLGGVLNSSLSGIMAFKTIRNASGEITDFEWILANQSSADLVGKQSSDLIGRKLLEEMPVHRTGGLFSKYVQVVETGNPLHLEYFYDLQGSEHWLEIVAVKMENGFAVTFADITEKKIAEHRTLAAYQELKKAEESLKQLNNELERRVTERTAALSLSEERFRLVSLATNDVLWDWNVVNNDLWWSEGLRTTFGYHPDDMKGGIESWYDLMHPDDKERVINSMQQVLNSGEHQWAEEYRIRKYDGTYAYIMGRGYVMHNEYEMPYRMLGSLIDLSSLKDAQEELKHTNANLIKINNDLDNFVYTASHDLKGPVVNLEALFQRLDKLIDQDDEKVDILMKLIKTTIEKFRNTVKDLTEISKIQKDLREDVSLVSLSDMLEDVFVNIREMIEASGADIRMDLGAWKEIEFSRKNLYSILYNLLSNAIKYGVPGQKPIIHVLTDRKEGYLLLRVEDNGLGINADQKSKLFTMFKRFHNHVDGTGVGLYIVKRIVENAGGRIEVESQPGKGSVFTVYFKISASPKK
jgi:two-component system CheB/CheR fusion protein